MLGWGSGAGCKTRYSCGLRRGLEPWTPEEPVFARSFSLMACNFLDLFTPSFFRRSFWLGIANVLFENLGNFRAINSWPTADR